MRKLINFILLTIMFTIFIFLVKSIFFGEKIENEIIEQNYLEVGKKVEEEDIQKVKIQIKKEVTKEVKEDVKLPEIIFTYIPKLFYREVREYSDILKVILLNEPVVSKLEDIEVQMYLGKIDVRGRMKDKKIKLFGVKKLELGEFISVFTHELAHYIDLYYFRKKVLIDPSFYFYDISWDSVKTIKKGQKNKDFVSGYAMTNKYEDFAESMTYYVLHNKDFLDKSKSSFILRKKYDFFTKYLFKDEKFLQTNFSLKDEEVRYYYWDITKIDINSVNFLQYLEKGI